MVVTTVGTTAAAVETTVAAMAASPETTVEATVVTTEATTVETLLLMVETPLLMVETLPLTAATLLRTAETHPLMAAVSPLTAGTTVDQPTRLLSPPFSPSFELSRPISRSSRRTWLPSRPKWMLEWEEVKRSYWTSEEASTFQRTISEI
jgi:hypothetical protein